MGQSKKILSNLKVGKPLLCYFFFQTHHRFFHKLISLNILFRKLFSWDRKGNFKEGVNWSNCGVIMSKPMLLYTSVSNH